MLYKFFKNKLLVAVVFSLLVAAVMCILSGFNVFSTANLGLTDALYIGGTSLDEIVIVAIDDKSLQAVGRWPWDRDRFADIIKVLNNAKAIGIDVSFFEKSANDKEFENAIKQSGKVVLPLEYIEFSQRYGRLYGEKLLKPVVEGASLGHINIFTDADGIARSFPPFIEGTENYSIFGIEVLKKYFDREDVIEPDKDRLLINFYGSPGSFKTYSFSDVLEEKINRSVFDGKIVLIGATSPDLHDEQYVPISKSKAMSGVEMHANIIQTILLEDFIYYQDFAGTVFVIFAVSLLTGLLLSKLRFLFSTILIIVLGIAYFTLASLFFDMGLILNIFYPFLSVVVIYIVIVALYYIIEERKRKWVTNIFGKYVSHDVAKEILEKTRKDEVKLEGSRRYVTILFADIRGFTSFSEKHSPEEVVAALNEYLKSMTEAIFEYKGTLDKYIGDAIMAVFNAPLEQKDHALLAVKAALGMQKAAAEISQKSSRALSYGIVINTGYVIVGNIGSEKRMEYTSIGDTVNLASRLTGHAEGGQILISEETYKLVKEHVKVKKLEKIKVKGKKKAVVVYEVVSIA